MAHDDDITPEEARERLWELAENIKIAMFITWDGEKQRARPMAATTRSTPTVQTEPSAAEGVPTAIIAISVRRTASAGSMV